MYQKLILSQFTAVDFKQTPLNDATKYAAKKNHRQPVLQKIYSSVDTWLQQLAHLSLFKLLFFI